MKKRILTLVMVSMMTLVSAWAADAPHVKVLSIGNSFSRDAFSYVPFLIEEMVPGAEVDFGILYIGGCRLSLHYSNLIEEKPAYEFDRYHTGDGHWTLTRDVSIQQGLVSEDWDIVILQQQSGDSRYYYTYQPYLNDLLEYIHTQKPKATLAWLLTQAYGTGHKPLGDMTSDEMWARTDEASQRVLDETIVSLLIPAGTAIQNARYTLLDHFGKAQHLTNDGYHLHEGIPPLIEGLVTTERIMSVYGVDVDVEKSKLKITHDWWIDKKTPQPNGKPEEATDEEYIIARRCAKWALEHPYQISVVEE